MESGYSLPVVDVVLAGIVLVSAVLALLKGFVREVLGIVGWLFASFAALYSHSLLFPFWKGVFRDELVANIATFSSVFVTVLFIALYIARKIGNLIDDGPLNALDRSAGFLFGATRGLVIAALLFLLHSSFRNKDDPMPQWLANARTLPVVEGVARGMVSLLPGRIERGARETTNLNRSDTPQPVEEAEKEPVVQKAEPAPKAPAPLRRSDEPAYDKKERDTLNSIVNGL
jgi:membrane protein required for colicin V production